ncbi:MAG: radical SAM protein, partial [Prevotella sp.]|nr:radical SAM protein [Prevotella sp.]
DNLCLFNGHVIIQTMFMTGETKSIANNGEAKVKSVDNTSEAFIAPWLEAVKRIKPSQVMIYTIDRETPDPDLRKASKATLDAIRDRVIAEGIPCSASY